MDQIESIIVLAIIVGLFIIFLKGAINNRPISKAEFKRMSNEYSEHGFFVDPNGVNRMDVDYLIDIHLKINRIEKVNKALKEIESITTI